MLTGILSLVTFDSLAYSLLAPAFILIVHIMEGQFLTPLLLGRRLELNAVAVFISISFWSWLWGFVGALMAVPLLAFTKSFVLYLVGAAEPPLGRVHPPALPLRRRH